MCGTYSLTKSPKEIGKYFDVSVPEGLQRPPSWNIRRTENVLGIARGEEGPQLRLLHWGMFIPVTSQPKPKLVINAKAETAPEKRGFRELISSAAHRVIVPAELWYERRYAFDVPDCEVIGFAGLAREVTIDGETRSIRNLDDADLDELPALLAGQRSIRFKTDGLGFTRETLLLRLLAADSNLKRLRIQLNGLPGMQPGRRALRELAFVNALRLSGPVAPQLRRTVKQQRTTLAGEELDLDELALVRTYKVGSPDRTKVLGRYKLPAH
jgi:hypothetical protein